MPQLLLFPDPRPLVERLGQDFFKKAPSCAGVYLMRDAADTVLYVGKAKNLRKRLSSYRVANPGRMPRRHLRMLRAVCRIETEQLPDEASALARESELLRSLKPKFNRAGTWTGPRRFIVARAMDAWLELAVAEAVEPGWSFSPPMGAGAFPVRAALVRLLWCALRPDRGLSGMPSGWFAGRFTEPTTIASERQRLEQALGLLGRLWNGDCEPLLEWVRIHTAEQTSAFDAGVRTADAEALTEFAKRHTAAPALNLESAIPPA